MSEQLPGRDLAWLERRRAELFGLISQIGDFRRGALNRVWRKCGKPNCACAQPGHRGHGPQRNLTRRIGGKMAGALYPHATHIVDIYHAREHLYDVANHLAIIIPTRPSGWSAASANSTPATSTRSPPPRGSTRWPASRPKNWTRSSATSSVNAHRMRYQHFRDLGMLTGSGAIEGGIKAIVVQRAKQSGMHWTTEGAADIIALRCQHASSRRDELWPDGSPPPARLRTAI